MWKKIYFNAQNIEHDTGRAVLINCPKKSSFGGWSFWHPSKLVREEGGRGYHLSFSFTEEWEFKLFKQYKTGENPQRTVDFQTMMEIFEQSNEDIKERVNYANDSYLKVTEPTKIERDVEVDESLKR